MNRRRVLLVVAAAVVTAIVGLVWWRSAGRPEPATEHAAPAVPAPPPTAPPPPAAAPATSPPVRLTEPATVVRDASGCAFSGRIVSAATGAGIPRAELTFSRTGEANAISGADDGSFCFQPPQAGRWTLASATAPGYLPFAPEWGHSPVLFDVREDAHVHGIVVTLVPEVQYVGRVVDPSGQPVAGAEVRILTSGSGESAAMPLAQRFVSDASGAFQFAAPDGAELEARHPAFGPGRARVDFAVRVARHVTISLSPQGKGPADALSITGRVEDPEGHPAEGALVVAYSRRTDRETAPRQATADASGAFRVLELPPGPWRLVASRAGLAPAVAEEVAAGATDVALRLRAGGRLEGTVRDRGGGPVAPFTVRVRWRGKDRFLAPRTLAVVDGTGRYDLAGLLPGAALVSVSAPGRSPSPELEVTIPEPGAPPATADFELERGGRVYGVAVDGATGAPLANAAIEIEGQEGGPSAIPVKARTVSGADGRFEVTGVPAGAPVSLAASAEGHHARIVAGIEVPAAGERGPLSVVLTPLAPGEDPRVELTGIGAVLASQGNEALEVVSVVEGGGAAEAGLQPGDQVLGIEGLRVADVSFAKAVNLIRGPEGSSVVLAVRKAADPQGGEQRVVVVRRAVRGPPAAQEASQ